MKTIIFLIILLILSIGLRASDTTRAYCGECEIGMWLAIAGAEKWYPNVENCEENALAINCKWECLPKIQGENLDYPKLYRICEDEYSYKFWGYFDSDYEKEFDEAFAQLEEEYIIDTIRVCDTIDYFICHFENNMLIADTSFVVFQDIICPDSTIRRRDK